jgi:putative toxin-antitoxin system antitoxin component (TIGR02293 family)
MRTHKIIGNNDTTHDQFMAVIFGTDPDAGNPLSGQEWINRIRTGLPCSAVTTLAKKIDVPQKEIAAWLHTTTRTIQRTMEANNLLSLDLSDRVAQLIRVYCRCRDVFRDDKKVSDWLKAPNYALGNIPPISLLDTIPGMEVVLDELGRIEHGVFI